MVTAIGRRSPALPGGARRDREMVVGRDADERARAAERAHARDRPVALARLRVAGHDAARRDVGAALLLEEARDRQAREVGIALDDLLAGARRGHDGVDGRVQAAHEVRSELWFGDAQRLGDQRAARQQVGHQRQAAAAHARDAQRLAVVCDERGGEAVRGIVLAGELEQPPTGLEVAEPRPQRRGFRPRHRGHPSG